VNQPLENAAGFDAATQALDQKIQQIIKDMKLK
jgi:phosphoglucomutase